MKRLAHAVLFLATALLALPLMAWTETADERIAQRSAELAPPDLRLLIERFPEEFHRGLERANADEGSEIHRSKLRARIESETKGIINMLRKNGPMPLVVEHLGVLVHLVGDANNPFHIGADDPANHEDFEQYFTRRIGHFPTYFYGVDKHFQLDQFLNRTFARTAKFVPLMAEEYTRGGEQRTSADFDDRSTAFGVASVCYSHAISDVVNLDFHIWRESGGDVHQLPRKVLPHGR